MFTKSLGVSLSDLRFWFDFWIQIQDGRHGKAWGIVHKDGGFCFLTCLVMISSSALLILKLKMISSL